VLNKIAYIINQTVKQVLRML